VINDALTACFTFEHDDQRDARILEKLEMMIRHNHRHSRDLNLHSETFALFLHFYFTMAPQISAADSEVRAARGVGLMNQFIDQLGAKMKMGGLEEIQLLEKLKQKRQPSPKAKETANA